MVKILALDTSTMSSSLALLSHHGFVAEYNLNLNVTHSQRLLPQIKKILEDTKVDLKELSVLALAIGPGSFTGLRIGFSTLKGLAFSLKIPLIGISTLDALAMNFSYSHYLICPMLDARKGEVYTSLFYFRGGKKFKKLLPDLAITPNDFCGLVEGGFKEGRQSSLEHLIPSRRLSSFLEHQIIFFGDGAHLYKDILKKAFKKKMILWNKDFVFHRATHIAFLAKEKLKKGKIKKLSRLVPNYIRPSEAELKRKKEPFRQGKPPL